MKYLLDTVVFLRAYAGQEGYLSEEVRDLLEQNEGKELYVSAVSTWEMAIKSSIGKLHFKMNILSLSDIILQMGLRQLPITMRHTLAVTRLPHHHRDPFDRLLICQAKLEGLRLISPDPIFKKYHIPVVW